MENRKKILWLTSWYPNEEDAFDGDFIQRQAKAAAIHHDVHVIMVKPARAVPEKDEILHQVRGLTEQIVYFKKKEGPFSIFYNLQKWKQVFRNCLDQYFQENGKPFLVHVHIPWKAGLMAVWLRKQFNLPFIVSEHWGIYHPGVQDYIGTRGWWVQKPLLKIYREAGEVISVSNYLARGIQNFTGKAAKIIPNVVDTTLFYQRDNKYSKFTFIHVSNMVPIKNVDLILEAFSRLVQRQGEVQLIMVGNRDDHYVRLASELGLLNRTVFFHGEISYQQVAEEIRRSHCLLIPSDSETFSCVTAEALCAGLPVIASRRGALPELVEEGKNGLLVEPEPQALLEAMKAMLAGYQQFDSQGISREATALYGYEAISLKFVELYSGTGVYGGL